jgi:hypothetical protein
MSTYSVEQLLTIWKQENMTAEQAVGHLLQHLALVYERVRVLERRVAAETVGPHHDGQPYETQRRKGAKRLSETE